MAVVSARSPSRLEICRYASECCVSYFSWKENRVRKVSYNTELQKWDLKAVFEYSCPSIWSYLIKLMSSWWAKVNPADVCSHSGSLLQRLSTLIRPCIESLLLCLFFNKYLRGSLWGSSQLDDAESSFSLFELNSTKSPHTEIKTCYCSERQQKPFRLHNTVLFYVDVYVNVKMCHLNIYYQPIILSF